MAKWLDENTPQDAVIGAIPAGAISFFTDRDIDDAEVRLEFPEHNRFRCEDVDVWMTHIGGYPPKYNSRVYEGIKAKGKIVFVRKYCDR